MNKSKEELDNFFEEKRLLEKDYKNKKQDVIIKLLKEIKQILKEIKNK